MTPEQHQQLHAILDALDDAVRTLHAADPIVVTPDTAVDDASAALWVRIDAQARAIARHRIVIEANRVAMETHRVVIEKALAANRAAVELLNQLDT